jgi:hypothetical protein
VKTYRNVLPIIGAFILAFMSFVAVVAVIYLQRDLRGWTPNDWRNPATLVEPTLPGKPAFAVGECLPESVSPYQGPSAEEYSGTATVSVLACRSRSSAQAIALAYIVLVTASLIIVLAIRRGRSRGGRPPTATDKVPNL